jgi:hypothetical protein
VTDCVVPTSCLVCLGLVKLHLRELDGCWKCRLLPLLLQALSVVWHMVPVSKGDEKEGLLIQNIVYICITLVSTSTTSFLLEHGVHLLQDRANRLRPV